MDRTSIVLIDTSNLSYMDFDITPLGWGSGSNVVSFRDDGRTFDLVAEGGVVWSYRIDSESGRVNLVRSWHLPESIGEVDPFIDPHWSNYEALIFKWVEDERFLLGDGEVVGLFDSSLGQFLWSHPLETHRAKTPPDVTLNASRSIVAVATTGGVLLLTLENGLSLSEPIRLDSIYWWRDRVAGEATVSLDEYLENDWGCWYSGGSIRSRPFRRRPDARSCLRRR